MDLIAGARGEGGIGARYRQPPSAFRSATLLAAGFALLILVGALLLMLPISTASGSVPPFSTALFTSTSAVCVTGLVVVDTGSYWSPFGQGVIYFLFQLGGIGFGAAATFLFWLVGRNISLTDRISLSGAFPGTASHRIARTALFIVAISLTIQLVGAIFLFSQWGGRYPFVQALFLSIFQAASAFCNSGFDLFGSVGNPGGSLSLDRHNALVIFPVVTMVMLGGLGFPVLVEILSRRRLRLWRMGRVTRSDLLDGRPVVPPLSLHARLALVAHLGLFAVTIILFWLLEFRNPNTLGSEALGNQVMDAVHMASNPRSSGLSTFSVVGLEPSTLLVIVVLMFIGTASASTGGGIKVNTVAALFASVAATIAGRIRPQIFKRSLSQESINKALAVVMIFPTLIALGTFLLSLTENSITIEHLLFEAVSAFATVGLSMDVTPRLSEWGRIIIELMMFVGRLGPLTLVILLSAREHRSPVTYAEEPILVG